MMTQDLSSPTVTRTVTVNATVERAFAVFTERFAAWWPTSHQINPNGYEASFIEPRVGGRWYERAPDGTECDWGTVLAWEPPRRLVMTWQLNGVWEYDPDPAHATEVEVRFTAEGPSTTRVDVVHSKLDRIGHSAELIEGVGQEGGWRGVLRRFADVVEDREPTPLPG
jgi:uncharacterized protein YndB with AHSA1/START domain